jgi:dTMP kinase
MLRKGILIVFEGIDGAGKSTQARILLRRLRSMGLDAVYFREPTRGRWGQEIKKKALVQDSLNPEQELALFQKDREDNIKRNLKPALKKKKIVILDRYYFSTIAYQGSKGIDPLRIKRLNERIAPKPDLVFILDIEADRGLARIKGRKKKDKLFEREDYLVRVRRIFKSFKGKPFVHLRGLESPEDISGKVLEKAKRYIMEFQKSMKKSRRVLRK